MQIITKIEDIYELTPVCVALGSFDGVHLGHQKLIEVLKHKSLEYGIKSMVYTFSNHPRKTTMPNKPVYIITDNNKRAEIFDYLGIDILYLEEFKTIMNMNAESFVREVLVNRFRVKCVIVGYNYRFGFKGEGDSELLKKLGEKYDFKVEIVPAVEIDGHVVSSSLIRHTIRSGAVENVPLFLGRNYSIVGDVIPGKGNGTIMGIKTANFEIAIDMTLPHKGVYMTSTIVDGVIYKSVTNIGYNPTFEGDKLSVETHLIGFETELYKKRIEVCFIKRIRDEKKFSNINELVEQINYDIEQRLNYEA